MFILLLIFVEEDVFNPVLPPPEIEPDITWFKEIEKDWINMAFNRDVDYNFVAFKFREITLKSISHRDFVDHYSFKGSLKSLSYNLNAEYIKWDRIRFSKTSGWKWIEEDQSYSLGWFEAFSCQDSVSIDLGARFYQLFNPFFMGGWFNYRENLDYGLILQLYFLRGEFGRVRQCAGFVNEWGEIKVGKFRDRFPMIFFPVEEFFPKVGVFYGTRIHFFDLEIAGGKKYFYADGENSLSWKDGKVYFAHLQFEKENFGFEFFYQNKGMFRKFGEVHANSGLGIIGSEFCLTGYLTPKKYITGGVSLWLNTRLSPFVSLRNLSWAPEDKFLEPVYYVGLRYAQ